MCQITRPARPKQRKPRPKPARSIRWLTAPVSDTKPYGAVRIACGKVAKNYFLCEIGAADGRGFELEVSDPDRPAGEAADLYHVFLHANGQDRSCECKGFLRHGHCKHADGLAALLAAA